MGWSVPPTPMRTIAYRNAADGPVREEYPLPCPLPARGRETLSLTPLFWSPPPRGDLLSSPLRGRDRMGGALPAPAGVAKQ